MKKFSLNTLREECQMRMMTRILFGLLVLLGLTMAADEIRQRMTPTTLIVLRLAGGSWLPRVQLK